MASGPWDKIHVLHTFLEDANLLSYKTALLQQGADDIHRLRQLGEGEFQQLCVAVGMANCPFHLQQFARCLGRHTPTLTPSISGGSLITATCTPTPSALLPPQPPAIQFQPQSPLAMLYRSFAVSSTSSGLPPSPSPGPLTSPSSSCSPSAVATAYMVPITLQQHTPVASQGSLGLVQPSRNAQQFVPPGSSSLTSSKTMSLHTRSVASPTSSFQPYVPVSTIGIQQQQQTRKQTFTSTGHSTPALMSTHMSPKLSDGDKKIFLPLCLRPGSQTKNFDELIDSQTPVQRELGPPPFTPGTWDPRRAELIRKYSAIYGQNTSKRKTDELSPHEENVNEASYQLCLRDPTLLVRRDELFILARRAVKKGGYVYTHHHKGKMGEGGASSPGTPHVVGTKRQSVAGNGEDASEGEEDETSQSGEEPEPKRPLREKRVERLVELETAIVRNKQEQSVKIAALDRARQSNDFALAYQLQLEVESLGNECHGLQGEFSLLKKNQRRSEKYFESKQKGKEEPQSTGQDAMTTSGSSSSTALSKHDCVPVYISPSSSSASILPQTTPTLHPEHTAAALEFERRNSPIFPTKISNKHSGLLSSAVLPFSRGQQQNHGRGVSSQAASFSPFHH